MYRPGKTRRILILLLATLPVVPGLFAAERLRGFSAGDTVSIRSDSAWEDEAPDTVNFKGHFELKTNDWYLSADEAILYGRLDAPDFVTLKGSPAFIQFTAQTGDRREKVTGEAFRIYYRRETNSIRLKGGASLTRAGQTMQSGEIEYDIGDDSIRAGGGRGVQIRVKPEE
jgi:lipopolysaccharide transport protein LptA